MKIDLENVVHVDDKSPGVQLDLTVIMVWRNSDFGFLFLFFFFFLFFFLLFCCC